MHGRVEFERGKTYSTVGHIVKGDSRMANFIKDMVQKKLKQISTQELIHYGKQYGFTLKQQEAEQITAYLKQHPVDPFDAEGRKQMFQQLARITDPATAKKAQKLFNELIHSYGLGYLFE